jgi:hypothetical protein
VKKIHSDSWAVGRKKEGLFTTVGLEYSVHTSCVLLLLLLLLEDLLLLLQSLLRSRRRSGSCSVAALGISGQQQALVALLHGCNTHAPPAISFSRRCHRKLPVAS